METCDKSELQLVGVTAMLIASKYEEMYAPQVDDFVFITDRTYSSDRIRSMERHMLNVLDYSFGNPLCLHFLRRYSRAGNVSNKPRSSRLLILRVTSHFHLKNRIRYIIIVQSCVLAWNGNLTERNTSLKPTNCFM